VISASNHARHIVATWPGTNTGDTVVRYGDGRTAYHSAQFVTSNCNCDSRGNIVVSSGTVAAVTNTPEMVGDEARDAELARRERASWMGSSRVHPPRMRENVRVIQKPEFHARSNPR
jgi:hypothetical protein